MLTALLLAPALAANVHVDVSTPKWSDEFVAVAGEPFTARSGLINEGKYEVAYEVIWGPAAHSVIDNGYPLEVTLCRVWAKGKKKDRDCITDTVVARPESEEQEAVAAEVKMSGKWSYKLSAWATGDDIPSTEMPMGDRDFAPETPAEDAADETPAGDVTTE